MGQLIILGKDAVRPSLLAFRQTARAGIPLRAVLAKSEKRAAKSVLTAAAAALRAVADCPVGASTFRHWNSAVDCSAALAPIATAAALAAADPEPCCSADLPAGSVADLLKVADYPATASASLRQNSREHCPEAVAGSARAGLRVAADCREAVPLTVRRRWEREDSLAEWP